ncbi:hypothetical protein OU994_19885 [Pseudoduganella sp. SL102]|uniref:hypothetical protein n=1 Tax=Pseudoduganella sp. SL102 TaxID=2995154 RepID=UPI00248C6DC4|nr:hypothetical protein [Pseudoduganella sp. SL102]WBS00568.1 hypothetical protein OU994_19885 [Pseudoduganella sp. SL102]
MEQSYIAILLGALVLAGVAKLVLSAGQSHILTIDYAKITDPRQLHRWAAKWLSRAAIATALLALAALFAPSYAELFLALFCILVLATAVIIVLGARKFRDA